jgi:hypothetical protein
MKSFRELLLEMRPDLVRVGDKFIATGTYKTYADFSRSDVGEIKNLRVEAIDRWGFSANFSYCPKLKVATGTYLGFVAFSNSGVEAIKDLRIMGLNVDGHAADFRGCNDLEVATGTYPGFVDFRRSGIEEIEDLHILAPSRMGNAVNFRGCNIKKISNFTYEGEILADPKIMELIAQYEAEKIVGPKGGPLDGFF